MAEPLKFDNSTDDRYNWPTINSEGASGPSKGSPGGAIAWLKTAMEAPKFPIALGLVLLYIVLFFIFLYTFMGHLMLVNIPPPEQPPQWAIDQSHQLGMDWPTPTPSPEYLWANDPQVLSSYISTVLLFVGILMLAEWLIIALGLHLFSKLFEGRGRYFPDMVSVIGYTYVPKILAMAGVILVVTQLPVYKADVSHYSEGDMTRYIDQTTWHYVVVKGLMYAGLLCSSLLGIAAVRYSARTSWTVATIVVGVPLALYLVYTLL